MNNVFFCNVTGEYGEPTINLPEKVTGTCLMGNKGHVVVKFEVKNKIFHSTDSLHRTLKGVFNTLLMKGNGKNFLGNADLYAELVKSGRRNVNEYKIIKMGGHYPYHPGDGVFCSILVLLFVEPCRVISSCSYPFAESYFLGFHTTTPYF